MLAASWVALPASLVAHQMRQAQVLVLAQVHTQVLVLVALAEAS